MNTSKLYLAKVLILVMVVTKVTCDKCNIKGYAVGQNAHNLSGFINCKPPIPDVKCIVTIFNKDFDLDRTLHKNEIYSLLASQFKGQPNINIDAIFPVDIQALASKATFGKGYYYELKNNVVFVYFWRTDRKGFNNC